LHVHQVYHVHHVRRNVPIGRVMDVMNVGCL
jgi:hypothetical protein